MSGLSRHIKQLDEELLALGEDSMLLEELDGFVAGLLVCPEMIMPGDWLWCGGPRGLRKPAQTSSILNRVDRSSKALATRGFWAGNSMTESDDDVFGWGERLINPHQAQESRLLTLSSYPR
jgi:uncharacterized protein